MKRVYKHVTRKVGRLVIHIELNFPHGQGWLSSITISRHRSRFATPCVRLSYGGYRLGHPFGLSTYRKGGKRYGIVHISVKDLTLSIIRA